jgi:hypothetical protein
MRKLFVIAAALSVTSVLFTWLAVDSRAQTADKVSLEGRWTLNRELSDQPPARERGDEQGRGERGQMGRGGFGGGGRRGSGYGRGSGRAGDGRAGNPEEIARMREALRVILQPGDQLTITQSDSMILVTDQDGYTTRLSADGKKIKDDNTNIERKTRWEGGTLISEINGAGRGKIIQRFSTQAEAHQLRIAIEIEGRDNQKRTITQVYDAAGGK